MNIETKAQLSKTTLYVLMLVASCIIVGTVVIILCTGLSINPFRERTSGFLVASFMGLIGIAFVSLFLNVAANLSLLAEAKILEQRVDASRHGLRPWFIGVALATFSGIAVVAGGARLSERKFLAVVRGQAEEILSENDDAVVKIGVALKAKRLEALSDMPDLIHFLESRRRDLPDLELIYAGEFQGKRALRVIRKYNWNGPQAQKAPPPYFECDRSVDCDYLSRFFDGQKSDVLEKISDRDSYRIYFPEERDGMRFVLLFGRTQSYGKLGS